jgi:hypothetical protein
MDGSGSGRPKTYGSYGSGFGSTTRYILGVNSQAVQQFLWMFLIHKLRCSVPAVCPLFNLMFFPMCTLCMYVGVFLSKKTHRHTDKTYELWNLPTNRFSGIQIRKLVPTQMPGHKKGGTCAKLLKVLVYRRKIFLGVGGGGWGWRCLKMGCVCLCCLVQGGEEELGQPGN